MVNYISGVPRGLIVDRSKGWAFGLYIISLRHLVEAVPGTRLRRSQALAGHIKTQSREEYEERTATN